MSHGHLALLEELQSEVFQKQKSEDVISDRTRTTHSNEIKTEKQMLFIYEKK